MQSWKALNRESYAYHLGGFEALGWFLLTGSDHSDDGGREANMPGAVMIETGKMQVYANSPAYICTHIKSREPTNHQLGVGKLVEDNRSQDEAVNDQFVTLMQPLSPSTNETRATGQFRKAFKL